MYLLTYDKKRHIQVERQRKEFEEINRNICFIHKRKTGFVEDEDADGCLANRRKAIEDYLDD